MHSGAKFDVVIVGGGPAGSATTLSLFKHSGKLSCLIIDDADPDVFKIGESLPPEAIRLLHRLDGSLSKSLTEQIASGVHRLCTGNASAWATATAEERHAILNPFGHGLHLDRAAFDETMRAVIVQLSQKDSRIALIKGRLIDLQSDNGCWAIRVEVGDETRTIHTEWLIDASGRRASLATKLGRKIITPNALLAFYALFVGPELTDPAQGDNDNRTLIEAAPEGWFYSSLLSRSPCTRIVVFHTLPGHPAAKQSRRHDGLLDILQASAPLIAQIIAENDYTMDKRGGYPRCTAAGSSYLDKVCDSNARWLAVGDAAVAFDPLSSQGMVTSLEMGFYVGTMVAQQIEGTISPDLDNRVNTMYRTVREDYERQRRYHYGAVGRFKDEEFWKGVCS
ncbi:hypothetical protein HYPSUDRAFT_200910 [Hypholoma sublateritium FD-334 SS-4]|uniref:FAD-binding domain-containing protein n=1 Tax=Hypholoma sublateritium (strain FD-334 SS-4) TaxID=945553 RepID=A0A0D2NZK5_HYPSF|nr:hypothetical protein HYPSUDRAFT_200910 [Hypholoma sublateritium FD-334 SS-4]